MSRSLAVFFILASATASAQDLTLWGEAGGWTTLVDPSAGNGCLAEKSFEDGSFVQIGAEPLREGGFFAIYNAGWPQVEAGLTGVINFDFGTSRFAGDAVARTYKGMPGWYAFFDNPNFVTEFGKRRVVRVSGNEESAVEIDLKGTTKAIEAVLACQKQQPAAKAD